LEFPLTEADQASLARIEQTQTLEPGRYVCVHPGGRGRDRRWPPERFARIADAVAAKGLQIVITGTSEERALANAMLGSLQGPSVDLVGRTDLGTIGALLAGAKLLIANDTGVSHLAAALRVPSVIVTTGSDPVRWGPLDRRRHRVLMGDSVTTADVIDEVEQVLGDPAAATGSLPAGPCAARVSCASVSTDERLASVSGVRMRGRA
ncbi:MAG TPA: glycosyltransferase family 9 protein, partial [Nitrospiraceae bacterium]|nr:glycosyltransferase family 9 protein [Nitrospiraceae bacterium]